MKILKEKFLREEEDVNQNSTPAIEGGNTPVDNNSIEGKKVWKVTFNLGNHENWSRYESETEDEAKDAVMNYITNKWPDREFEIISVEEFNEEELEEQLNEKLTVKEDLEDENSKVNRYLDFEIPEMCRELLNYTDGMTEKQLQFVNRKCLDFQTFLENMIEFISARKNGTLDESLTDASPIKAGAEIGMANVISDLIKDEYEAIDGYNSAIATAQVEGFEDAVRVLTEIQAEENIHIGQLQEVMKLFDPNAGKVEDGQAEGAEQIANPIDTDNGLEDASITEDLKNLDDLLQSLNV